MIRPAERFPVEFDFDRYLRERRGEILPRRPIRIEPRRRDNESFVRQRLALQVGNVLRPPQGVLRHPYIVPGGPYDELWDWDAYFAGLAICEEHPAHFRGAIDNFMDHLRQDGRPPKLIRPDGANYDWFPLPVQAQWCALAARGRGGRAWLASRWEALERCRAWFESHCLARRGLFRLETCMGYGIDNEPAVYGRPANTVGPVDVNVFHCREYAALATIARRLKRVRAAQQYAEKAGALREAINRYMWDPIDGMYYHLDLSDSCSVARQAITWELPCKIRSCACLWPLWAGLADPAKARRTIREHVLNPREFWAASGIRSLAANERMYNNRPMGNPSNWQGPVWGLPTALVAYGLARYGFRRKALELAGRLVATFAADLRVNGVLHEVYHGDTGQPVIKPGFLSWNLLAIRLMDDIRRGRDPAEM